jgi:hypothetical protein
VGCDSAWLTQAAAHHETEKRHNDTRNPSTYVPHELCNGDWTSHHNLQELARVRRHNERRSGRHASQARISGHPTIVSKSSWTSDGAGLARPTAVAVAGPTAGAVVGVPDAAAVAPVECQARVAGTRGPLSGAAVTATQASTAVRREESRSRLWECNRRTESRTRRRASSRFRTSNTVTARYTKRTVDHVSMTSVVVGKSSGGSSRRVGSTSS